jgi:hypothetical protein
MRIVAGIRSGGLAGFYAKIFPFELIDVGIVTAFTRPEFGSVVGFFLPRICVIHFLVHDFHVFLLIRKCHFNEPVRNARSYRTSGWETFLNEGIQFRSLPLETAKRINDRERRRFVRRRKILFQHGLK